MKAWERTSNAKQQQERRELSAQRKAAAPLVAEADYKLGLAEDNELRVGSAERRKRQEAEREPAGYKRIAEPFLKAAAARRKAAIEAEQEAEPWRTSTTQARAAEREAAEREAANAKSGVLSFGIGKRKRRRDPMRRNA